MSDADLASLERSSAERNSREDVTGLVMYDEGRFFQLLEGPAESVSRVWASVRRDQRHDEIEVLDSGPISARLFGGWSMKLLLGREAAQGSFSLPAGLLDGAFVPSSIKPALAAVLDALVIPAMVGRRPAAPGQRPVAPVAHARASELARLLLANEATAASELVAESVGARASLSLACATLLEPAARRLGDLWYDDACSAIEVTLGLHLLQQLARELAFTAPPPGIRSTSVLVSPVPGELHGLGAALDAELLWQAGWDAYLEFPATDAALEELLASTGFDAVDLTLSCAVRRDDWQATLIRTIARARAASRNPELVVVVGGRVFSDEEGGSRARTGADASCATSADLGGTLVSALRERRRAG
jgi:hypothetical protein